MRNMMIWVGIKQKKWMAEKVFAEIKNVIKNVYKIRTMEAERTYILDN